MVIENSACVSRYAANRPRELPKRRLLQAAGEDAGGDLAILDGKIASATDGAGAIFGRKRSGLLS